MDEVKKKCNCGCGCYCDDKNCPCKAEECGESCYCETQTITKDSDF